MTTAIDSRFGFKTDVVPVLKNSDNRKVLRRISQQILDGKQTMDELGCMTEQLQVSLHYMVVRRVSQLRQVTRQTADAIYRYVEMLNRFHRGLFWKVFNYFNAYLSNAWYMLDKKHTNAVLYALLCDAPKSTGHYKMQAYNLDNVWHYPVNGRVLGMRKSGRHMEFAGANSRTLAQAVYA